NRSATASVASPTRDRDGSGGIHPISGNRAIPAQATEQLRSLSFLVRSDKSVLSGLAGLELERLVLSESRLVLVVQTVVLHLRQLAHDGVDAAGLVVNDVPGAVLDGVPGVASLGGHVIPHALDGILDTGRLSSEVVIHAVDSSSVVAAALLELGAQVTHSSVHPVEAVGHSVLDGGLAVLEVLERKAVIDVCTGQNALGVGAAPSAKAAEHTAQTTKTTEAAQTAETEATAT